MPPLSFDVAATAALGASVRLQRTPVGAQGCRATGDVGVRPGRCATGDVVVADAIVEIHRQTGLIGASSPRPSTMPSTVPLHHRRRRATTLVTAGPLLRARQACSPLYPSAPPPPLPLSVRTWLRGRLTGLPTCRVAGAEAPLQLHPALVDFARGRASPLLSASLFLSILG